MADFSFLSDSDDEKAVQELLSQAMDQTVLEQVAKINCAGFSDSGLPTPLETRFLKLKSFPSAESKLKCSSAHRHSASSSMFKRSNKDKSQSKSLSDEDGDEDDDDKGKKGPSLYMEKNLVEKSGLKGSSKSGFSTTGSKSSSFSDKDEISSHCKKIPEGEKGLEKSLDSGFHSSFESEKLSSSKKAPDNSRVGKLKFPDGKMGLEVKSPPRSSNSSDSTSESLSPPPRKCCFWCSPKRMHRKKSKEGSILNISLDWGDNDEILSDLSNFSVKNQQKLLKKAMKEEEKISREAEKIVKWAKQASSRMEVSSIEDDLSASESFK